mgnify:CR=1 FL=1
MVRARCVAPWLCFATLMACCVPGTLGWWRGGHMLTAQVAVTRLTPDALHACQLLLGETRHIEPHLLALPEASKVRRLPFAPLAALPIRLPPASVHGATMAARHPYSGMTTQATTAARP